MIAVGPPMGDTRDFGPNPGNTTKGFHFATVPMKHCESWYTCRHSVFPSFEIDAASTPRWPGRSRFFGSSTCATQLPTSTSNTRATPWASPVTANFPFFERPSAVISVGWRIPADAPSRSRGAVFFAMNQNASSASSISASWLPETCFGSMARFGNTSLAKNRAEATLPS